MKVYNSGDSNAVMECKKEMDGSSGSSAHRPRGEFVQEDQTDEAYVTELLRQCWHPAVEAATPGAETAEVAPIPTPALTPQTALVHIVEVARPVPMSSRDVATWLSATVELTDWLVEQARAAPDLPLFRAHAAFLQDATHRAGYLSLRLSPDSA
jgi:hypothetical protein